MTPPSDAYDIELRILSQPRYLCVARAVVSTAVERIGFPDEACGQVMLAVDEALTNIIRHGYHNRADGPIWLRITPVPGPTPAFRIVIEDEAEQVSPDAIHGRDLADLRPGGLGVHIIRQVMDVVEYAPRPGGGMRLTMTKTAPACTDEHPQSPATHPPAATRNAG